MSNCVLVIEQFHQATGQECCWIVDLVVEVREPCGEGGSRGTVRRVVMRNTDFHDIG